VFRNSEEEECSPLEAITRILVKTQQVVVVVYSENCNFGGLYVLVCLSFCLFDIKEASLTCGKEY
jgi:hypothetical protein